MVPGKVTYILGVLKTPGKTFFKKPGDVCFFFCDGGAQWCVKVSIIARIVVPEITDFIVEMSRNRSFNQRRRRGNRNNRRLINQRRSSVVFEADTTYQFSSHNADGVFILSRRKRAPPTAEQLEAKKQKKDTN